MLKEASIAPVALDLGITMLHRAQSLADPAARKAELEQAEKTFLAIRGLAGGTEKYRLYLGQVYYWLGRPAEGKKLFDELLADCQDKQETLVAVSSVLREVGDTTAAASLLDSAYAKETDAAKRQTIAVMRLLLCDEVDDKITWLGRANQSDPAVRTSLATARGHKAVAEGNDDGAKTLFQQAIDGYKQMPESAATLNNCALVYFALFHLSQEQDHFTRGLDMIDKAVGLNPTDSILLHNAATVLLETAVADVLGATFDWKVLKRQAGLDLLPFLQTKDGDIQKIIDRLRKHAGVVKARAYFEKLLILAPKRSNTYAVLAELFDDTNDLEGLRTLRVRLERADLDLADARRRAFEYYRGGSDDKRRAEAQGERTRQEAILAAARQRGGRTLAVAASSLAKVLMAGLDVEPNTDVDRIVKLADEAHQASPCAATHSFRVAARCCRGHTKLVAADPTYADLARLCERSLSYMYLLAFVLADDTPLRAKALANSDIKQAIAWSLEYGKVFPSRRGPWSWALVRAAEPDEAARIAARTLKDEQAACKRAIDKHLAPWSGPAALNLYWLRLMDGKDVTAAREELRSVAAQGTPLPVEVKP